MKIFCLLGATISSKTTTSNQEIHCKLAPWRPQKRYSDTLMYYKYQNNANISFWYTLEVESDRKSIDTFTLWWGRRLLKIWWAAKKTNKRIIEQINTEFSFETQMMRLTLLYFGHNTQKLNLMEKALVLGKVKESRRRGQPTTYVTQLKQRWPAIPS